MSVVIGFQLDEEVSVSWSDEVDGNTFSAETTRSTDSVDVLGRIVGHVVVDDQVHLLDIDATAEQISGNQDSSRT